MQSQLAVHWQCWPGLGGNDGPICKTTDSQMLMSRAQWAIEQNYVNDGPTTMLYIVPQIDPMLG